MRPAIALLALVLVTAALSVQPASSVSALDPASKYHGSLAARIEATPAGMPLRTIVQFDSFANMDAALVEALGGRVLYEVQSIPALFVYAPAAAIAAIAKLDHVILIEYDEPIQYDMDTAILAGNVAPLWAVATPNITMPDGTVIDGRGVGVAVVDTGVNALNGDLKYKDKVVRNMQAVGIPADPDRGNDPFTGVGPINWNDQDDTDGGGHGSHVAGIVAGSGAASSGKFKGSAPGASIYGFGSLVSSFWYAVAAWDWIAVNGAQQSPPIKIVTNSWGYSTGTPCDLSISLTKVEKILVLEKGVTMFFSAGNAGGSADGKVDTTRTQFKCPWEGIIGVANMDDQDSGNREGPMASSTSKGKMDDPVTWPDISAPGSKIMAAQGAPQNFAANCLPYQLTGGSLTGCYTEKSGTSMSTPFTAGVGALLLQARPDLKPADVEFILEQTAYKFGLTGEKPIEYHVDANMDYRHDGSHFIRGHGLVDAEAAVRFALNYTASAYPVVYKEGETPAPWRAAGNSSGAPKEVPEPKPVPGLEALGLLVAGLLAAVAFRRRR
jgi:serine protease AprX